MLRSEEFFVQKEIARTGGMPELDQAVRLVHDYATKYYEYTLKDGTVKPFTSKNRRLSDWNPNKGEIYEIVLAAFTITLTIGQLTYQAIAGMLAGRIGLEDTIDRVKTAAEVLAVISRTGLITITRNGSGEYITVCTEYTLNDLPELERHEIFTKRLPLFTTNKHEEHGSFILGGRQNHHKQDICLDHLNRMNAIELKLNRAVLRKYEEKPTYAFETDGRHDQKKEDQWKRFVTQSYRAYIKLVRGGNRFHLLHRVDKRGRCYAEGYHINTQGSSFKKSIIQLAAAELVEM